MEEADFWKKLEVAVCREFLGMSERRMRYIYCDGFIPEWESFDRVPPVIGGRVWMGIGREQQKWRFEMPLPVGTRSRDEIEWEDLLPIENTTSWLDLDWHGQVLRIDPESAVLDFVPPKRSGKPKG